MSATVSLVCPCCGQCSPTFLTHGSPPRPNAKCPDCGLLERHRLLWLFLWQKTSFFYSEYRVLHFAPESYLQKFFSTRPNLQYISADLNSPLAKIHLDITRAPFTAEAFDVILCLHVLEHITEDFQAMRELCRILKPGGWAILQVPLDRRRDTTFEDSAIITPDARRTAFGQHDHVRIYGRDYATRLVDAGFEVHVDDFARQLPKEIMEKYSIKTREDIYLCRKPEML